MSSAHRPASSDIYTPLNTELNSSFRVITLLPGEEDEQITCLLSADDWDTPSQPYEALSYCWGTLKRNKTILLDGKLFKVTSNLYRALRCLRRRGRNRSSYRRLWIDAICINQANVRERNQEVLHMFHIYNAAQQVVVWLGDTSYDSEDAMAFANNKLRPRFESKAFSCVDEQANIASKFWEYWDTGKDAKILKSIDHLICERYVDQWSALARLLQRPWWSRAWTVQELISARKVSVQCGKICMPWPLLDMIIAVMLRNEDIESLYHDRHRAQFHNAVEDAFGFAYERSRRILDGADDLDFVMLMQITRYRNCQDPRDKVFSILSLLPQALQDNFRPDYQSATHLVYASAAKYHIQTTKSLHLLSPCHHSRDPLPPRLVSWVPAWQSSLQISFLGGYATKDTNFSYCASGNSCAVTRFSDDLRTLTIRGMYIDTIKDSKVQGTSNEFKYSVDQSSGVPRCSWDLHQIAKRLDESDIPIILRSKETVLEALFKTLIVDREPASSKRRQTLKLVELQKKWWPTDVMDYLAHAWLWSEGRTLVLSEQGHIGLAPASTVPGDQICILFGFHAPIILRQRQDSTYTVIGDAYVHKLMDGEAVTSPQEMRQSTRSLVLQ